MRYLFLTLENSRLKQPSHVETSSDIIPEAIISSDKNVTISIYIMFVNRIAFLVTISRYMFLELQKC